MKKFIRVLVTGGPTRAYLDRVRFLSNVSTGELAYRLSEILCRRGVRVGAVVGPTAFDFGALPLDRLETVETTEQMRRAVLKACREFKPHYGVFAAAVLDFEPVRSREGKVSSSVRNWKINLKPTPKIIDEVGKRYPTLKRIGFKLEWKPVSRRSRDMAASSILRGKGLEALCLNYLSQIGRGGHPAHLYGRDGSLVEARTKLEIAKRISDYILSS